MDLTEKKKITLGPSREVLLNNFAKQNLRERSVIFNIGKIQISVELTELKYEDGSGYKFLFEGYHGNSYVIGFFDAEVKTGYIVKR